MLSLKIQLNVGDNGDRRSFFDNDISLCKLIRFKVFYERKTELKCNIKTFHYKQHSQYLELDMAT